MSRREHTTFVDLIRARAAREPDRAAYTFLGDGDGDGKEQTLTHARLDARARAVGARLQALGARGGRVLLLLQPGLDYLTAFFGCMFAGAGAVPVYPSSPGRRQQAVHRLRGLLAYIQPEVVLFHGPLAPLCEALLAEMPALRTSSRWVAVETIGDEASGWRDPELRGDSLAVLQCTSGSTAMPKVVMLTHDNIFRNSSLIQQCIESTPESRLVAWLPPYHDLGLIGAILHPLHIGFPSTMMSPFAFLRRPLRWLQAISRTGATISGAPSFAYQLCVREIPDEKRQGLDLSRWEVAVNGSEPIAPAWVERFAEAYAPFGFRRESFRAAYGLAESTLFVSASPRQHPLVTRTFDRASLETRTAAEIDPADSGARRLAGCGRCLPGQTVLAVDPETLAECPEHRVGEIWVADASVAQGYWRRDEENARSFGATLPGRDGLRFLRTGDLGFFHDGELFITGRIKDVVIIRGRNHDPADLELTVEESHPALRPGCGAAFSVEDEGDEQLVVVHEVRGLPREEDVPEIVAAIREAVVETHEINPHAVVLVQPGTVPKTSSGKIARQACRRAFLDGSLAEIGDWRARLKASIKRETPPASAIEAWFIAQISRRLKVEASEIDVRQPFSHYGLDSREALGLAEELETWLGRTISPALIWDYPTIELFSRYLVEGPSVAARNGLPPLPAHEPIAIIGYGCRLPGAPDPESLWRLLRDGRDAIVETPPDRWDNRDYYDPNPDAPGKMSTRWGGFLPDVACFDPTFFGISPREADRMDPQQRLLMEVTWEALECAGMPADKVAGSHTAVFVGIGGVDYSQKVLKVPGSRWKIDAHVGTGNTHSIAANRLSYSLDLRGPSLALDTACSSSLVAIHLACQTLWNGESEMALAGGVNLILSPEVSLSFSHARMLAPDGRCKTFDANADGYVRAEGSGMLLLKPLSHALRDRDPIHALIRGSAVNQDGRTPGITAPSGLAQQEVIRTALARARLAADQLGYIETHGTGTKLGDPIEVRAIAEVIGPRTSDDQRCYLGSIKANIGHAETASGVAGLIKVILCMKHRELPPQIHLQELNPHIKTAIDGTPLEVVREHTPWPNGKTRFAGVSSFGFGGMNAHIILEEPPRLPPPRSASRRPTHVLCVSARSPKALKEVAQRHLQHMRDHQDLALEDVCFSLNAGRSHFTERVAVAGDTAEEIRGLLDAFVNGRSDPSIWTGRAAAKNRPRPVFLFTGQGAQYPGMGRALYETHPVFRGALDRCAEILGPLLPEPLLAVMYHDPTLAARIHETAFTQPALFALEYALSELWRSFGVQPVAVLGHSVGEYVAATVAGVFSLEDGLRLIAERARLMQSLPSGGKMTAVFADEHTVAAAVRPFAHEVDLAAINSPATIVISGAGPAIARIVETLEAQGVRTQALTVSHAFHSPLMDPILDAFEQRASEVTFRAPTLPLISNLTGQPFAEGQIPGASYWRRHVRDAVRFAEGMGALVTAGHDVFLEIGPSPTLITMGRRCAPGVRGTWLCSLREGKNDWHSLSGTLAAMFVAGVPIDWAGYHGDDDRRKLVLPTYPFERERHWWLDFFEGKEGGATYSERPAFPLLGHRQRSSLSTAEFEAVIGVRELPFLADHQVQGAVLYPATGYLSAVHAAARTLFGDGLHTIQDVAFQQGMFLPSDGDRVVHTVLNPPTAGQTSFAVTSLAKDGSWTQHATGRVQIGDTTPVGERVSFDAILNRCVEEVTADDLYAWMESRGMLYGPLFRGVKRLWRRTGEAFGEVRLPPALEGDTASFPLHPVLLDACMHVAAKAIALDGIHARTKNIYLPARLARLRVIRPPAGSMRAHVVVTGDPDANVDLVVGDMRVYDEEGHLCVEMLGLEMVRFGRDEQTQAGDAGSWLHDIVWREKPLVAPAEAPRGLPETWLVFAERDVGEDLAAELSVRGHACLLVGRGEDYRAGDGRIAVRSGEPADLRRLLDDATRLFERPPAGVVYLWGLETDPDAEPTAAARSGSEELVQLVKALAHAEHPPRLWLVTRGAQPVGDGKLELAQTPLVGLGRVIALEHPELRVVRIDMTADAGKGQVLAHEIWSEDGEDEVVLRSSGRWVPRLARRGTEAAAEPETADTSVRLKIPQSPSFHLATSKPGRLDNLVLRPTSRIAPGDGQIEIAVRAAGLNFRDLMNAMGLYPGKPIPFGAECAGVITAVGPGVTELAIDDEVMAVAPDSFANFAITHAAAAQRKPAHLSFEEAATVPITFLTAHYGLNHLARMTRGERVLIHSGAGGVGLAAVQMAQLAGAEIFATAGTPEKRSFLEFVGVHHALDSHSLGFADEVMRLTGGRGVDIVLNSLPGEYIATSLSCLAPYGRFVEIGRVDIYLNRQLPLYPFHNNLSYFAVDLDRVCRERSELARGLFGEITSLFERRMLKPLPRRRFSIHETIDAFRYMAQRKNIGKVIVSLDGESVAAEPAPGMLRADASYLITGGLGDLGLALARWMVSRGARNLVLLGRGEPTAGQRAMVAELESTGARVVVARCDVANRAQLAATLADLRTTLPPLRGVIHAAGVLDDGLLVNLDGERLRTVLAPKVDGAWNLHSLTANDPLDLFVLFSSVASVFGSPGQGNYAAGNSFLDGLAQLRRQRGLPALSINWGPWDEIGMAARTEKRARAGKLLAPLPPAGALEALEKLLAGDAPQVVVVSADWNRIRQLRAERPSPLLDELGGANGQGAPQATTWNRAELVAIPAGERKERVVALLQSELAKVMGIAADQLKPDLSLRGLGLDSLMGLEMKESIESGLHITIPIAALMEDITITDLATKVVELVSGEAAVPTPVTDGRERRAAERPLVEIESLAADQVLSTRQARSSPSSQPDEA